MHKEIIKKGIYKHFKGDYYFVEDIAIHSETEEVYVIYRALYEDCGLYIRPLEMFLSPVDKQKYPDCKQDFRFEYQNVESKNYSFK